MALSEQYTALMELAVALGGTVEQDVIRFERRCDEDAFCDLIDEEGVASVIELVDSLDDCEPFDPKAFA